MKEEVLCLLRNELEIKLKEHLYNIVESIISEPIQESIQNVMESIDNEIDIKNFRNDYCAKISNEFDFDNGESVEFLKIAKDVFDKKIPNIATLVPGAVDIFSGFVVDEVLDHIVSEGVCSILKDTAILRLVDTAIQKFLGGIELSEKDPCWNQKKQTILLNISNGLSEYLESDAAKKFEEYFSNDYLTEYINSMTLDAFISIVPDLIDKKMTEVTTEVYQLWATTKLKSVRGQLSDIISSISPESDDPKDNQILSEPFDSNGNLKEQHFTIKHGEIGYTYESIFGPYLKEVKHIRVEDPFIRNTYQIKNFVVFCELAIQIGDVNTIQLITSSETKYQKEDIITKMTSLKESLNEKGIELLLQFNHNMHDRKVILDNCWIVKIGRGLDFYKAPENFYAIGSSSYPLRRCKETDVDIYKDEK